MPFCSSCGTEVSAKGRFCQACGHQLVPEQGPVIPGQTPASETPSAAGPNFLGPMTLGSFLGETFRIYKRYSLRIWAIVVVAEVLITGVTLFFTKVVLSTPMAELQGIVDNLGITEAELERLADDLVARQPVERLTAVGGTRLGASRLATAIRETTGMTQGDPLARYGDDRKDHQKKDLSHPYLL